MLANARESAFVDHIRKVARSGRRRRAGDAGILARAETAREPFRPLAQHPEQRFFWRALSWPRRLSSSRALSMRNSARAMVRRWASIATPASHWSHAVISFFLFAASSAA